MNTESETVLLMKEFYRELIQFLPDIVYQVDDAGNFIYLNDTVSKLGYEPDELLGKHFSIIISPSRAGDMIDRDVIDNGRRGDKLVNERRTGRRGTKRLDIRLLSRDGKTSVDAQLFATGYYGNDKVNKKFFSTIGIIREVSVDRSEKMLVQVEKYYRLISTNSSETIFIIAYDGTILSVSDSAKKNLGVIPFDTIGENLEDIIYPDDIPVLKRILNGEVHRKGRSPKVEFRVRGREGRWFYCETSVMPVEDVKDGGTVCFILNLLDITTRKAFESAQERRERIYRTLLRVSPDAIILFDKEGDAIMSNDRAAEIAAMPREEIIGRHFLSMVPDGDKDSAMAIGSDLLREGTVSDRKLDFVRHDGVTIPLEFSVTTVRDPRGMVEGYLVVFRDVTAKRKAEADRQKLEDDLLKIIVNRLSDREIELLGILAQGFRWPDDKKEIGSRMNALPGTLDQFVYRIRKKMEMTDMDVIVRIVSLRFGWNRILPAKK